MTDGNPADIEHIKRLLAGEAEESQSPRVYKRRRHRARSVDSQESTVASPAAEAVIDRARQPSDKSTSKFWHCELCDVRVGRPHSSSVSPAAAPDWDKHVRGKLHRRNQASVHLHGEAGHSVVSVFEQEQPPEKRSRDKHTKRIDKQLLPSVLQELVQHGGLGAVNTAAGFALSKGSIRLAQPALQYLDSPKEKICALGSCTPGKIAALAQHPRLGSLEHMVISIDFVSECLFPALSAALCVLLEAIQAAQRLHTFYLGVGTAYGVRNGRELRPLLLRVIAAAAKCLASNVSLRLLEIKVDPYANRIIGLCPENFQPMEEAAQRAPQHRRSVALWSLRHGKLKAVAQMPRDVQLLILQHAAPLQSCQVRWLLTLPPVTAS